MKTVSISLPRIDAEDVVPFTAKDAKGYFFKERDSVTLVVSGKSYVALFRIVTSILSWLTRFLGD